MRSVVTIQSIFAIFAFVFSAATYVPYVKSVLGSNSKPTISSWLCWLLMDSAILAGMIAADEIAWQMVAYVLGVIAVISACVYKKAPLGWSRLDSISIAIVSIAIVLWVISGNPNTAIILSLIALTVGTIPMWANLWKDPTREPLLPWVLVLTGGIFGVMAIPAMNIAAALTPIYFLILQILTVWLILRRFSLGLGVYTEP